MLKETKAFTLVELIIVVIIVGILASLGLTQYSQIVEKSRLAEANLRIGVMRAFAHEYYLNNGDMSTITNADLGISSTACASTDFYSYYVKPYSNYVDLLASRCTSGGKAPNASKGYVYGLKYYPSTGQSNWECKNTGTYDPCFGLSVAFNL